MEGRKPNLIALVIVASIYWGSLVWWQRDRLFGDSSADQTWALTLLGVSFPYVGFVIWGVTNDLPESMAESAFGRWFKPVIWLSSVTAMVVWGWLDQQAVGFLLVGVALLGLAAGLSLSCRCTADLSLADFTPLSEWSTFTPQSSSPMAMSDSTRSSGPRCSCSSSTS